MIAFLGWFLTLIILGWISAPLAYRLFPNLPDRGFFFSKILGLLLLGFSFWLLVILGVLRNESGAILMCMGLIALLSFLSLRKGGWTEWRSWLGGHKKLIISGEVLFLAAFGLMALLRAANPEIVGTEKPMELAFINSILRSPTFPPHDPWLSGYAISYYYFGYVMSAILIKLSGVSSGVGFNLSIGLWFGLTALAAYGLLFNLLNAWARGRKPKSDPAEPARGFFGALLAPLFVLVLGNLEGFLEMLHSSGLFWNRQGAQATSVFWKFLNIAELTEPPTFSQPFPYSLIPARPGGIWWWRASRVLQDFDLQGNVKEIIDEFPFFSYLLSDLHPHVLSMPFVLLAVAFALNFYLGFSGRPSPSMGLLARLSRFLSGAESGEAPPEKSFIAATDFWAGALIFGGLSFLNTWDFPIYVGLFCVVFVLVKVQTEGWRRGLIIEFLETGIALGMAGVLLYLPFYIGFSSQAGGLLPSLAFFTRGVYFWVMFGILLVPIFIWLLRGLRQRAASGAWKFGLKIAAALVFGLWLLSYGLSLIMSSLVAWAGLAAGSGSGILAALANRIVDMNNLFTGLQGGGLGPTLLGASLVQRLAAPGVWITLFALLTLIFAGFKGSLDRQAELAPEPDFSAEMEIEAAPDSRITPFVLVILLIGAGLTLLPEFFYLRDQFGWRMNTIFKFYFQTWILWSIVGAYATIQLWERGRSAWLWLGRVAGLVLIVAGLAYPTFGVWTKTNEFHPSAFTLDGNAYMQSYMPGEVKAIEFLRTAPLGVVAEAIGGSYSNFARVSTHSGQPTVLGWPGHESQWRGGSKEIGSRETDIERLYRTADWGEAQTILTQYNIRYVYVGSLEKSEYHVNDNKFAANLPVIFKNDEATIYEAPNHAN